MCIRDRYEVYYQGEKVFVPAGALTSPALDAEALDKEMKKAEEEDIAFIESLEIQRKAIARSKIWSLLISVLILAMFITGIVSAWKKGKNAKAGKMCIRDRISTLTGKPSAGRYARG